MIDSIRRHLGFKLFLSYIAVILVGGIFLVSISQLSIPTAYNHHMLGMDPSMMLEPGMMGGGRFGFGPAGPMNLLYQDFRNSFNEALAYAVIAAMVAALAVSLFFSRQVVAPVRDLTTASQRIAEGHYEERVRVGGQDELALLAERFNQMAEKLEQVETMRQQLIGDVSHELRTPLTAIKGSMEGLVDGVLPATSETYQQIHDETERLSRLVDDLQELSRVEARAYPLHLQAVDISTMIGTVLKRLASQLEQKHIVLNSELPSDLPMVMADDDRTVQVLTNLISNAVQYTPEGGSIGVTAAMVGNEIQIVVEDNGIGIPAEHLPHVFERFYRADKSRSRRTGGGSGIGLTIARHLVEAQGGRIWAESEGAGRGSKFTFTLPVAK